MEHLKSPDFKIGDVVRYENKTCRFDVYAEFQGKTGTVKKINYYCDGMIFPCAYPYDIAFDEFDTYPCAEHELTRV